MNVPVKPPRSILDPEFKYVPAEDTNIAVTFQRELAKMRTPYYESAYDEVTRTDWLEPGGFR